MLAHWLIRGMGHGESELTLVDLWFPVPKDYKMERNAGSTARIIDLGTIIIQGNCPELLNLASCMLSM